MTPVGAQKERKQPKKQWEANSRRKNYSNQATTTTKKSVPN